MLSQEAVREMETHSPFVRFARIFTVPILNALPASLIQKVMRASSHDAATVVAKGGSTHALEAMYTRYHRGLFSRGFLQGIADMFWHHFVSQPKALRNRLRVVQSLLEREINARAVPLSILSIAGGSARALIHTLIRLRSEKLPNTVRVVVLDKDATALEVGKRIAESAGIGENFQWVHGNANNASALLPVMQFDIVEIVGLLDYFEDERTIRLLETIRPMVKKGGMIIAANVLPNTEQPFVHKTGWPAMHYRTDNNFAHLVARAGYAVRDTITEPLGVHVVVCVSAL